MIIKNNRFSLFSNGFLKLQTGIILTCFSTRAILAENKHEIYPKIEIKAPQVENKSEFLSLKKDNVVSSTENEDINTSDLSNIINTDSDDLYLSDILKLNTITSKNNNVDTKINGKISNLSFDFNCVGSQRYEQDKIDHSHAISGNFSLESDLNKHISFHIDSKVNFAGDKLELKTLSPAIKFKNKFIGFIDSIHFLMKGGTTASATNCSSSIPFNSITSNAYKLKMDVENNFKINASIGSTDKKLVEIAVHTPSTKEMNNYFNELCNFNYIKDKTPELQDKPWSKDQKEGNYYIKDYNLTASYPVYGHINFITKDIIPLIKKISVSGGSALKNKDYNIKDAKKLDEMNFRPWSIALGSQFGTCNEKIEFGISGSYLKGSILSTLFKDNNDSSKTYSNNYFTHNNSNLELSIKIKQYFNILNLLYFRGVSLLLNGCGFKGMSDIRFNNVSVDAQNDKTPNDNTTNDNSPNGNFFSEANKGRFLLKDLNTELCLDIRAYNLFLIQPTIGFHILQYLSSKFSNISDRSIDTYLRQDYSNVKELEKCESLKGLFQRFMSFSISISLI